VFLNFLDCLQIIPINTVSFIDAAMISGRLKSKGIIIANENLLIASMMLNFGIDTVATKNKKHFSVIPGIKVASY